MVSFEGALFKLWPHGDDKIPGLRAAIVKDAARVFETYGINTKTAMLQFMAQISHECGAGLDVEENLNYSASRMTQVWPSRFPTIEDAVPYANNPQKLANKVYNGRMGNQMYSNDGWNFRGRGGTQVTGREGYTKLGQKLGIDLTASPSLVNDPKWFLEAAAADFVICGCLLPALSGDLSRVTRLLNGGYIGIDQRKQWLERWTAENVELPFVLPTVKPTPSVVVSRPVPDPAPSYGFWSTVLEIIKGIFTRKG